MKSRVAGGDSSQSQAGGGEEGGEERAEMLIFNLDNVWTTS